MLAHAHTRSETVDKKSTQNEVLKLSGCTIDFKTDSGLFRAVENVDFTMYEGEKIMLLGPSGCGKSTILKAIGGFIPLSSGQIELNGKPIGRPGPDRVLVFQDTNQLFPGARFGGTSPSPPGKCLGAAKKRHSPRPTSISRSQGCPTLVASTRTRCPAV